MVKSKKTPLNAYQTYLPELEDNGSQAVADCPFCGKEKHFFINTKTGQHHCKVCAKAGNLYAFLEHYYLESLEDTTAADHDELSELREGFPVKAFKRIAKDGDRWLIPSYNRDGAFSNLRMWYPGRAIHSTATCSVHLIGIEELKDDGPIFLVEGDWDYFTLSHFLPKKLKTEASVVAAPGCNTFKEHWIEYFDKRDVYLIYDNDGSGSDGMDLVEKKIGDRVSSLQRISWPDKVPEKYDISDYCVDNIKRPKKATEILMSMCKSVKALNEREQKRRDTPKKKANLNKIIAAYKKVFRIGRQEIDAITLCQAVIASVQIKDDPLWLFIVGPPGSGKTALVKPLDASEQCITRSRVTPASLVSGFVPDSGNDPSLIPKLQDKCFVLKDWTEIKSMSSTDEELIYGIMRGAYDGKVEFEYGNDVYRKYENCWFSLVAGVTPVIHGDHRASLGERFLKFELISHGYDATEQIRAAMSSIGKRAEGEEDLADTISTYTNWVVDEKNLPKVPKWVSERILYLSQIIAMLRMDVDRTYKGDLTYRPQVEIATRLAKQLVKLAISISIVQNKPITKETYRLVKKVALDTAIGWGSEVCILLMKNPKTPQNVRDLENVARIPPRTLDRKLQDLVQIRAVDTVMLPQESVGRPSKGYLPSKRLCQLWKSAKMDQD